MFCKVRISDVLKRTSKPGQLTSELSNFFKHRCSTSFTVYQIVQIGDIFILAYPQLLTVNEICQNIGVSG